MDIKIIKALNEIYRIKMKNEQMENRETIDIYTCTRDILIYEPMLGTEVDELTWGEYTRRYNLKMKELHKLLRVV
jgi:hypothetical protein